MDPKASLFLLLDLIRQGELIEANHTARDLETWFAKDGYYPDLDNEEVRSLISALINLACLQQTQDARGDQCGHEKAYQEDGVKCPNCGTGSLKQNNLIDRSDDMSLHNDLTSDEAETLCIAAGLSYLGRDPYSDHRHHVAEWSEGNNIYLSVGWIATEAEFLTLLENIEYRKSMQGHRG